MLPSACAPTRQSDVPGPEERLFAYLTSLNIAFSTVWHTPIFTAEEGKDIEASIPGLPCKNLFLKDKKGKLWLVVMPAAKRADLSALEKRLGGGRLSFGKTDLMIDVLGITPGSVTPFALINDLERRVTVVLDQDMMQTPLVSYHPLRNDASTSLRSEDLLKFIKSLGYSPLFSVC